MNDLFVRRQWADEGHIWYVQAVDVATGRALLVEKDTGEIRIDEIELYQAVGMAEVLAVRKVPA